MDVHRLKELSKEERQLVLESEHYRVEEQTYMRPLEEQELADYRTEFSQKSIELDVLNDELKAEKERIKAKVAPLQETIKKALSAIRNRGVLETGKVYLLPDYNARVMHIVSAEGVVINSRMLKPEERQYHINANQKTA